MASVFVETFARFTWFRTKWWCDEMPTSIISDQLFHSMISKDHELTDNWSYICPDGMTGSCGHVHETLWASFDETRWWTGKTERYLAQPSCLETRMSVWDIFHAMFSFLWRISKSRDASDSLPKFMRASERTNTAFPDSKRFWEY